MNRPATYTVLLVEPNLAHISFWTEVIETFSKDFKIEVVTSLGDAVRSIMQMQLKGKVFDLIISEIFLKGWGSGIDLWAKYKDEAHHFILSSAVPEETFKSYFINPLKRPSYICKSRKPKDSELIHQLIAS